MNKKKKIKQTSRAIILSATICKIGSEGGDIINELLQSTIRAVRSCYNLSRASFTRSGTIEHACRTYNKFRKTGETVASLNRLFSNPNILVDA